MKQILSPENVPESSPENPKEKRFEVAATPTKNDKSMESEINWALHFFLIPIF